MEQAFNWGVGVSGLEAWPISGTDWVSLSGDSLSSSLKWEPSTRGISFHICAFHLLKPKIIGRGKDWGGWGAGGRGGGGWVITVRPLTTVWKEVLFLLPTITLETLRRGGQIKGKKLEDLLTFSVKWLQNRIWCSRQNQRMSDLEMSKAMTSESSFDRWGHWNSPRQVTCLTLPRAWRETGPSYYLLISPRIDFMMLIMTKRGGEGRKGP